MVVDTKAGVNVPLLKAIPARVATADGARVTVTITVLVATPFCAVSIMVITVCPTGSAIDCEAVPDTTAVPLTVMVAVGSCAVGITCMLLKLLGTVVLKLRYPDPVVVNNDAAGVVAIVDNKAFDDAALRVTVMLYVTVVPLALTAMFMMFEPTLSGIAAEALPEVTGVPLTVIVAVGEVAVGVTVICVVA